MVSASSQPAAAAIRAGIRRLTGVLPNAMPGTNYLRQIDMPYERYILDAMAVFDEQDRRDLYAPEFGALVHGIDPYRHQLLNFAGSADRGWEARDDGVRPQDLSPQRRADEGRPA